jgi:serine phosphatase RsbU (regulator of sigma subunit)
MSRLRFSFAASALLGLILLSQVAAQDFYWENPFNISEGKGSFPQALSSGKTMAVAWQESESAEEGSAQAEGSGRAFVSIAIGTYQAGGTISWKRFERLIGPIPYSGNEPSLFSICPAEADSFLIAYPEGREAIAVAILSPDGRLEKAALQTSYANSVSPRVFRRADGGFYLFVTQGESGAFSLVYSTSNEGLRWTSFTPFLGSDNLQFSFLPACSSFMGMDMVVFQSLAAGATSGYNLYEKHSRDSGASWSQPKLVTGFRNPSDAPDAVYDNQNPSLSSLGGKIALAWERGLAGKTPQIWYSELALDGSFLSPPERVSPGTAACSTPVAFTLSGKAFLSWSDTRMAKNRVVLAMKDGSDWRELGLGSFPDDSFFARPVSLDGRLCVFWQSAKAKRPGVYALVPDGTVNPPEPAGANFKPGVALRQDGATVRWSHPEDSSGIEGYSTYWGRDPAAQPPKEASLSSSIDTNTYFANADGPWYFAIRAKDFAGNWSQTARIEFLRDTQAPASPRILPLALDSSGYATSNSFSVDWESPADSDVRGYTYSLRALPEIQGEPELPELPSYRMEILSSERSATYKNIDDGLWLFELAAIDRAGNVSPPARRVLRTDKFVPYTVISSILPKKNDYGELSLSVYGRGFTDQGNAKNVYIDLDGRKPYDLEFALADGGFKIVSNRIIEIPKIENLEAGSYRIGIDHPVRGLYFTEPILPVDRGGTVKFGPFIDPYKPSWKISPVKAPAIPLTVLAVGAYLLLCAAFGLTVVYRLAAIVEDSRVLALEIKALIQGAAMPKRATARRITALVRRRSGLRLKFSLFVIALVVPVVLMVSLPLSMSALQTQRAQLASSLYQRSEVLLESLVSRSADSLNPANPDIMALLGVPEQKQAMDEATYITITGYKRSSIDFDVIWATNDSGIKLKTSSGKDPTEGETVIQDSLSPRIEELRSSIQADIAKDSFQSIKKTLEETRTRYLEAASDTKRRDEATKLENDVQSYYQSINAELSRIANGKVGSVPEFNPRNPNTGVDYLFYKPVLRFAYDSDTVLIGMVRLEVSTAKIRYSIVEATRNLLLITAVIALISIGFGILGALFLSAIIIKPIKSLVHGIEIIRDTVNKEDLASMRIDLRTGDELSTLSDTINQMTKGLVRGARDNADLLAGEQDQRELLPLESDAKRKKLSVGKLDTPDIEFYGYYKGAKLVSGDYLDFRSLDGRYYAFIKCDVSGKGVSAAMIMAIVASVFRRWFEGWTPAKPGFKLENLCYEINDTLNVCEFKGKFATLMVGIVDSRSGTIHLCHSGDKFYRVFEASSMSVKTYELPGTAPAGPFSAELIKMQSPFRTSTHAIASGDILLLYTDGIDEARRYLRDDKNRKIPRVNPDPGHGKAGSEADGANEIHEYQYEDFGNERAAAVVEAVMERRSFTLSKESDPSGDSLEFDFSDCSGKLEDIVLALVSVEKIFRMFRSNEATQDDQVKVDVRLDAFLKVHFKQYYLYCSNSIENPEEKSVAEAPTEGMPDRGGPERVTLPHYLVYTNMFEDDQYDDITVLTMRKK